MAERLASPVEHSVGSGSPGQCPLRPRPSSRSLEAAEQPSRPGHPPAGFPGRARAAGCLRGAACAMVYVGEYEQAIPLLLEAEQSARRMQSADQIFNVMALLTQCWFRLDRWEEIRSRRGAGRPRAAIPRRSAPARVLALRVAGDCPDFERRRPGRGPIARPLFAIMLRTSARRTGCAMPITERRCRVWRRASSPSSEAPRTGHSEPDRPGPLGLRDDRGGLSHLVRRSCRSDHDAAGLAQHVPLAEEGARLLRHRLYQAVAHRRGTALRPAGRSPARPSSATTRPWRSLSPWGTHWQLGRTLWSAPRRDIHRELGLPPEPTAPGIAGLRGRRRRGPGRRPRSPGSVEPGLRGRRIAQIHFVAGVGNPIPA